jgi:hypothetical protein
MAASAIIWFVVYFALFFYVRKRIGRPSLGTRRRFACVYMVFTAAPALTLLLQIALLMRLGLYDNSQANANIMYSFIWITVLVYGLFSFADWLTLMKKIKMENGDDSDENTAGNSMNKPKKRFLKLVAPYLVLLYAAFALLLIYRLDIPEARLFRGAGLFSGSVGFLVILLLILLNRKVKN